MFKVVAYKDNVFYGQKTGKNAVLSMLVQELKEPDYVYHGTENAVAIYKDGNFEEIYVIPIEYWNSK